MTIFDELKARGLIAQVTNEEEIREMVNNGKKSKSLSTTVKLPSISDSTAPRTALQPDILWLSPL